MTQKYFKDLIVWQKSMDLAVMTYKVLPLLPKGELYALSDQIRRSVISIPSNIAEGQQRNSDKDFLRFLHIAKGSLGELETQIILCQRLGFLQQKEIDPLFSQIIEVGRLLNGLINNITLIGRQSANGS
ncbi:MAG: four helix bundle protein [Anaerolineaceae bacterium]|nr:four helix bundle protein [Anaerolineaceae bacterium]